MVRVIHVTASHARRTILAACMGVTTAAGVAVVARPASASTTICVGTAHGCYRTIQAAADASHDGDTIRIGSGTFAGGVTITTSVRVRGSGASSTIIRGGGHVLTIGAFGASSEPVVSISGVTITGGVARSSPISKPFFGVRGLWAAGGGVEIPPQDIPPQGPAPIPGARVTISDSVIIGNRADPVRAVPSGIPCPGGFPAGQCPFALAAGGGIDSWGHLTLVRTAVIGNTVGPAAGLRAVPSDSDGAGIYSQQGSVRLDHVLVSGNHAVAATPDGRFAEGGGVFIGGPFGGSDTLAVRNSVVARNSASLTTSLPKFAAGKLIDMNANSGGIHVGDHIPTTVDNTAFTGNSVMTKDLRGEPIAFDSAMLVGDSRLTMRHSIISGNKLFADMATTADTGPAGTALELDGGGTISNTRITGNTTTALSPRGVAGNAGAGLAVYTFPPATPRLVTVRGSVISGNTAIAKTPAGSATVQGVGILNNSLLRLRGVRVSRNVGKATGLTGIAQGGGIWNGVLLSGPPVQLALVHTRVTHNSLTGSPGITLRGGGLFTTLPVTLRHSVIALNRPDQCFGCTNPASAPQSSKIGGQHRNRAAVRAWRTSSAVSSRSLREPIAVRIGPGRSRSS
jgi:hypothetical protein